MWAGLRKSTRNAEGPRDKQLPFSGLKGQKDERNSVIGAQSPKGVSSRQEPLFRDATMTGAETPKQKESAEEILTFLSSCQSPARASHWININKPSDKQPR